MKLTIICSWCGVKIGEKDCEVLDETFTGDADLNDEPADAESKDDFTAKDWIIVGGALGFGYEILRERKRRKRKRFSGDDD